ncbi:MAG: toast rack family protein [Candidatus Eisenbacteria bacterium]
MIGKVRIAGVLLVLVSALLLAAGCGESVETGDLVILERSLDLVDVESVGAVIEMGAGKLAIGGGSGELMDAEFVYNVAEWKPEVTYQETGDRGTLTVRQRSGRGMSLGKRVRYEWDIQLNDEIPMDLDVELGAGTGHLDLGSLSLKDLSITAGAGEVTVLLTGHPQVRDLEVQVGAGDVTVDLTGDWKDDLDADIKGGVGRLTLRLPTNVGVRVDAEKGIGKVSAGSLVKKGGAYVNEAYGRSDVTLRIDCAAGIGSIILETGSESDDSGVTI